MRCRSAASAPDTTSIGAPLMPLPPSRCRGERPFPQGYGNVEVGQLPVQVALAGHHGAGITAPHGDHHIGSGHLVGGQLLRSHISQFDPRRSSPPPGPALWTHTNKTSGIPPVRSAMGTTMWEMLERAMKSRRTHVQRAGNGHQGWSRHLHCLHGYGNPHPEQAPAGRRNRYGLPADSSSGRGHRGPAPEPHGRRTPAVRGSGGDRLCAGDADLVVRSHLGRPTSTRA